MTYVKELFATRELLANLTMREVKGQYRRTFLGQLWSLINPLATTLVYTIVFLFLLRFEPPPGDPSGVEGYPLWLMCGMLPWSFFTRVVNGGLTSVVSNAGLIKKVYFPRMHLPLAVMASTAVTWSLEMAVLAIVMMFFGSMPLPFIPVVLLFMALLCMFSVGLAMMLAIVNVHFRDTQHFMGIILQMWMFLTPIIYPLSFVEQRAEQLGSWVLDIYRLNPMERFVAVFRNLLYDNRLPAWDDTLYCLGAGVIVFLLGYWIFSRNEKRLAELL
jgi:ABC-2 type transport system permease protein